MIADIKDSVDVNEILIDQKPAYKKILNANVSLELDEKFIAL